MKKISILYIDDNPMDKALVRDSLERESTGFAVSEVANREELEQILSEQKFDLVLSDFNILGFEGLQVIDYVKKYYPETPVIIVTGTGSEEIAVEAMKRIASDYIIKSPRHIKKLPQSIRKALKAFRLQKSQDIMHRITEAVLITKNLTDFIGIIKEELGKVIDTTNFFLALYDEQSNTFQLPYFSDSFDKIETFPAEKTISHYVVETQKPLLARLDDLIELEKKGIIRRIGTDSLVWLGVPLIIEGNVIGIMVVQHYSDEDAYTKDDMELFEIIATQVSLAILDKKRKEELELLNNQLTEKNKELTAKIEEIEKYTVELKKAKEKAEESERLKSAFLANMSHEIRTPINGIFGFLQLLKEPNLKEDDRREYIQFVINSSRRLLNTINSIIELSQIDAGSVKSHISEFNLTQVVKNQYNLLSLKAKSKGLDFKLNLPEEEIFVKSDLLKIESILTNIINNAIKYTDKGFVDISLQIEKDDLVFKVKDSGMGIPKEAQKRIFDRFYRVNLPQVAGTEGNGLGLSIVKGYVELLGGKLEVKSTLGKGSEFSVRFNKNIIVDKTAEKKIEPEKAKKIKIKKNKTILVAEDDDVSYFFIKKYLEKLGIKVKRAKTGNEAIELCKENSDIDLVLMDIKMPSINGNKATVEILKSRPGLPIIAQTAYAFPEDKLKALQSGCVDYISKPISPETLLELLAKYL